MNYFEENPHIAMIMYARNILRNWIESEEAFQWARLFGTVFIKILEDGQARGDVRKDINMRLMNWIYHGGIRQMTLSWLYRPDSFKLTDAAEGYAEAIYAAVKCPEPAAFMCPYYEDESSKNKGAKAKSKKALKAG